MPYISDRYRVLSCPFCGRSPEGPRKIQMRFGETTGGHCECGAVYVYDETGRMLGEAFNDALALLYREDYDAAYSAAEGEYEEEIITYEKRLRRYAQGAGPYDRSAKYLFLKKTSPVSDKDMTKTSNAQK